MITILGVGHVFDLGPAVRAVVEQVRPGTVAVELDEARYRALVAGGGRRGPGAYGLLGAAQMRLARQYGVRPGGEMLAAVEAARAVGARVALIDMDSRQVVRRMLSAMGTGEKVRFFFSAVAALFIRRSSIDRNVAAYEANPDVFLDELGRDFPSVKRVLLEERDAHMARQLRELEATADEVVAVVGEGHVGGLGAALADRPVRVVRLQELRGRARPPAPDGAASAGGDGGSGRPR